MDAEPFEYRRQARNPRTYMALGVAMSVVWLAFALDLRLSVRGLALIYLALVLWRLGANPRTGFRLDRRSLRWFGPRGRRIIALGDLASVTVGLGDKGGTVCFLNLADGRTEPLPGAEAYEVARLRQEFGARGVPVHS
ncbi:MAG: hypothetical protein CVT84_05055 [Alphaproteobacteria bacterium HGW-Alphaproteobacteria-6]|nr:MAG: hypothetical protein CVT84_05055 [Alphaproteobacteria bacterium HGW-Alphaproteobacteria-6]